MRLLGHTDKKHRFQFTETYLAFPGQRMFYRQDDDGSVPGNTFPLQVPGGCGRMQPDKAQVNLPGFQRAKLFRRGHVEEVQGNVREGLAEGGERFREQLEVKVGQIGDVQLASFSPAEPLHGLDAFGRQGQNAPDIHQERAPFLGQGHVAFRPAQEADADLLFQVMNLPRQGGLR